MSKKQLQVVADKKKKEIKEPKKVLLIYPIASVASPQMSPPLPILHVGESIKKYGHEVRYFDERWDPEPDLDWPDVVGVSSMTGYQLKGAIRYLKLAKQHGKKTVFGGIHPTAVPEQCIKEDYVDVVVQSEGELAMLDAIEAEPNTIVERQMVTSEDMVSPVSDDTIRYFQKPAETGDTILLTSRGCPFRCGFCLDGETPVLMRDLSWRPIRKIKIGDEVVSFSEFPLGHKSSWSTVLATSKRLADTIEIVTNKGSTIATPEHPWLLHNSDKWITTDKLKIGDSIRCVLANLDIGESIVQEIKLLGEQEVYDIETTDHNFIANGLISHNCYIQNFFSRSWQTVDMDRWKADILRLRDEVGMNKLEHGDDWPGKMPRILEIVEFLWSNGIEYRPSIRAHQIDDEAAKQMADMGIKHISVGMETGSARMLKLTQKDIQKEHQVQCAEALAKHGIWPLYYWITGFPTETVEEVNETLDQAQLLYDIHQKHGGNCTQNFYAYTALPGSPLYDLVDKEQLPKTMEAWSDYSLHQTYNKTASNLYHIGGLYFHRGKGDKTDRNFPGLKRLLIAPFELSARLRWKYRYFDHYWEKRPLEWLLKWASTSQMNELSGLGGNINEDDRVSTILENDRCT